MNRRHWVTGHADNNGILDTAETSWDTLTLSNTVGYDHNLAEPSCTIPPPRRGLCAHSTPEPRAGLARLGVHTNPLR